MPFSEIAALAAGELNPEAGVNAALTTRSGEARGGPVTIDFGDFNVAGRDRTAVLLLLGLAAFALFLAFRNA
ncbi:MAG: hypothetical protein A3G34_15200 [Candidatus Lindowbacteria bacterium RIFCSPLOWO2_12_FULL_62_27]|nr:MAG: hypothetical protein A3G34_15200 [Candidatus Lindowbacteria bacterium RIFCSPLOWO2_12_FULL_62_27]OGH63871.1 MAG: hypothetical protein A3I06_06180 [Candidatus Lindowbacteria bacterium RIFCSPLOWO2_02_FULL_62_12]